MFRGPNEVLMAHTECMVHVLSDLCVSIYTNYRKFQPNKQNHLTKSVTRPFLLKGQICAVVDWDSGIKGS